MSTQYGRLVVEYDGSEFRGWARQPDYRTVQGELTRAFDHLDLAVERMRCAGRTDAGVHAAHQVVSIAYDGLVPVERLALALNQSLPDDVAVVSSEACDRVFDARAHARSRAYEYRVLARRTPSPLRAHRVLFHPRRLDRARLDAAAAAALGQHDFTAFTPKETSHTYFHRTVMESRWEDRGDELVYCIRANAFLRHMVRVIIGSMLAVGRGDWELEQFVELLDGATRDNAHNTALPHALCLTDVDYG